jgi:macrodomain Ter protein organizer (MatP/YcbG family)
LKGISMKREIFQQRKVHTYCQTVLRYEGSVDLYVARWARLRAQCRRRGGMSQR